MDTLKSALASYIAKKVLAFIASRFSFALVPPWGAIVSYVIPWIINWAVKKFSSPEKVLTLRNVQRLRSAIIIDAGRNFHMENPKI